jgi:hypothetical protein
MSDLPSGLVDIIDKMSKEEFGAYLHAHPDLQAPILRARFRTHIEEFFNFCIAPSLRRNGQRVEKPGRLHHDVWARLGTPYIDRQGVTSTLIVAPRGVSKSTTTRVYALHAYLHATEQGILFIGPQRHDAVAASQQVQDWLREPEVIAVYGDSRISGTQTCWYDAARNIPVWARGWDSTLRGLIHSTIRPTLVICDDVESERNTRSEMGIEATIAKLTGACQNLGPLQGGLHLVWIATPVSSSCAVARAMDGSDDRFTAWDVIRLPAVLRYPARKYAPQWEEAKKIYSTSEGSESERWARTMVYIRSCPEIKRPSQVLSTRLPIEECYRRRWQLGDATYMREIDVSPSAGEARLFNSARWPRHRYVDGYIHPDGCNQRYQIRGGVVIHYDPSDGGDDGALVATAVHADVMYCLEIVALRKMTAVEQVDHVARLVTTYASRHKAILRFERNLMSSLLRDALVKALETYIHREGCINPPSIIAYTSTENKERRIASLEGPADTYRISLPLGANPYVTMSIDAFDPGLKNQRDDILDVIHAAYAYHTGKGKAPPRDGKRPLI